MIKVSEHKAYAVKGIIVNDKKMVSIRQMYTTKNDPTWKPGKQGVTINVEVLPKLRKLMKRLVEEDDFETIELN